jgi:DNA replication protein DnaC
MARIHHQHIKENMHNDYSLDQYTALLAEQEWDDRNNRKIKRLIKQAGYTMFANMEDIDYQTDRKLDKNLINKISSLNFITNFENIIITGPTGVGKSYLAQAVGHTASRQTLKVKYAQTATLLTSLKLAKLDGTYLKELKKLASTSLLILDDFGLQSLDNQMREALLNIIQDRFNRASTLIVSQIPVSKWHDVIGEATIADAILDRLVHSSHRINIKGESYRKNLFDLNEN